MNHDVSSSAEVTVSGTAQEPRTLPWTRNHDGPRAATAADGIATRWGVVIPNDIRFIFRDDLTHKDAYAEYGGFQSQKRVRWSDFYAKDGMIPVKVRRSVLDSDEAIVAVLAHEMHELNELRKMFAVRETIDCLEINRLIKIGVIGNLHDQAWDIADKLVVAMRREGTC